MLVTSRESKRWVIPKGWPMKRRTPFDSAAREALEEAGLVGQIGKKSIGPYQYEKALNGGAAMRCTVEVFPLEVQNQREHWPEKDQRSSRWFSPAAAARAVREPDLGEIIRHLEVLISAYSPALAGDPQGVPKESTERT